MTTKKRLRAVTRKRKGGGKRPTKDELLNIAPAVLALSGIGYGMKSYYGDAMKERETDDTNTHTQLAIMGDAMKERKTDDTNTHTQLAIMGKPHGSLLVNLGLTCYMNATLHCLTHIPLLRNAVLSNSMQIRGPSKISTAKDFLFAFYKFVEDTQNPGKQHEPTNLHEFLIKYTELKKDTQECPGELYTFWIDFIEKGEKQYKILETQIQRFLKYLKYLNVSVTIGLSVNEALQYKWQKCKTAADREQLYGNLYGIDIKTAKELIKKKHSLIIESPPDWQSPIDGAKSPANIADDYKGIGATEASKEEVFKTSFVISARQPNNTTIKLLGENTKLISGDHFETNTEHPTCTSIYKLFEFQFEEKCTCNYCSYNTVTGYLNNHIQIEVTNESPEDIQQTLDKYFKPEQMNTWRCDQCEKNRSKKEVLMKTCPNILVIQLKRVQTVLKQLGKETINTAIKERKPIDIKRKITVKVGNQRENRDLFGVVVHYGETPTSGHYVAYVKSKIKDNDDDWYEMDDLGGKLLGTPSVTPMKWSAVIPKLMNDAYLLFYSKSSEEDSDDSDGFGKDVDQLLVDYYVKDKSEIFIGSSSRSNRRQFRNTLRKLAKMGKKTPALFGEKNKTVWISKAEEDKKAEKDEKEKAEEDEKEKAKKAKEAEEDEKEKAKKAEEAEDGEEAAQVYNQSVKSYLPHHHSGNGSRKGNGKGNRKGSRKWNGKKGKK
jgi:ubiquitin C-terminal hydrolase